MNQPAPANVPSANAEISTHAHRASRGRRAPVWILQWAFCCWITLLIHCGVAPLNAATIETVCRFPDTGTAPVAGLITGTDGNWYGVASQGGNTGQGTVFRMTPDGNVVKLADFNGINGASPSATLVSDGTGNLYGTTSAGGPGANGTVFKLGSDGTLTTLAALSGTTGYTPLGSLIFGPDGALYGTTRLGGTYNDGTVFKVSSGGTFTTLASLSGTNGNGPCAGLVSGTDGIFYGTASEGGAFEKGVVFSVTSSGSLALLASFTGNDGAAIGANPQASLVSGTDGCLYGITMSGGDFDMGTVFRVTLAGHVTHLVDFNGSNGANPRAALVTGTDGCFYGTTQSGGASNYGTVFKMGYDGTLTTLASFSGSNGAVPAGELRLGADGCFYGTTASGGERNLGTLFKVASDGTLTVLASLVESPQVSTPLQDNSGTVYATTFKGGVSGLGSVVSVNVVGSFNTLVDFTGTSGARPGANPKAGLITGLDGALYGTTTKGGAGDFGTVFKVSKAGTFTSLASFTGTSGALPGMTPLGALAMDGSGNLYGVTQLGGVGNNGTVFKIETNGTVANLASFSYLGVAGPPAGGLTMGADGYLYGSTSMGGASYGSVFRVTPAGLLTQIAGGMTMDRANGGVVLGGDGAIYGTSWDMQKMMFKVTPAGVISTFYSFGSATPKTGPLLGTDGNFYVPAFTWNTGETAIAQVSPQDPRALLQQPDRTDVCSFNGVTDGGAPSQPLAEGVDGNIYGGNSDSLFRLLLPWRTMPVSGLTPTTATLQATLNAGGVQTLYAFQWGEAPPVITGSIHYAYGMAPELFGNGTATLPVSLPLSDLLPNTVYVYRLMVVHVGIGATYSPVRTFITPPPPAPILTTENATDVTFDSAVLRGTINPAGFSAKVHFQYGATTGYGHVTSDQTVASGSVAVPVAATLAAQTSGATINYRIVATRMGTTTTGPNRTVTIRTRTAPAVGVITLSKVNPNAATVTAPVNSNGLATTVHFAYGKTTAYGSVTPDATVVASASTLNVAARLSGFLPHTTYHVRCYAQNSKGSSASFDKTFRTPAQSDVNGDGYSDLLAIDAKTRATWTIYTSSVSGSACVMVGRPVLGPVIPATLAFCGKGDFDTDGRLDWALYQHSTNHVQLWHVDGLRATSFATLSIPLGYTPVAVEDVDKNGKPDLILYHSTNRQVAFLLLNGTTSLPRQPILGPILPAGFYVAAVDDLTAAGRLGLLLWNPLDNRTKIMTLNGTGLLTTYDGLTLPAGWQLAGADAFTGDDLTDWVLYNPRTRATQIWKMNGLRRMAILPGPTLPSGLQPLGTR